MHTDDIKDILKISNPFRYLAMSEIDQLLPYCEIIQFKDKDIIFKQGSLSQGMFVILQGNVFITSKILGKGSLTFGTLTRGNYIGEVGLIEKIPAPLNAITDGEPICLKLSNTYFDMLSIFFPKLRYKIIQGIIAGTYERINIINHKISDLLVSSHLLGKTFFFEFANLAAQTQKVSASEMKLDIENLYSSPFFKVFSKKQYDLLISNSELIKMNSGCTLIGEEDKHINCNIIIRGAVQLNIFNHKKNCAKISVLGPMNCFCSLDFLHKGTNFINYISCERALILKINENELNALKDTSDVLWYKMFELIGKSFIALENSLDKLLIRMNIETYL